MAQRWMQTSRTALRMMKEMAWWDHEELKSPIDRSDRYMVVFSGEYMDDPRLKAAMLGACARIAALDSRHPELRHLAEEIMYKNLGYVVRMKMKPSEKQVYPDGTPKTFYPGRRDLNSYGYAHRETAPCRECGEWECDPNGVGHYRG